MKKWMIALIFVFVVIVWRGISIYQAAYEPVRKQEEHALKIAFEKTSLQDVDEVYTYYGTKAYQVIQGTNADDEKIIVWIAEDDDSITVRKKEDGITKEEAIQLLKQERNPKEIRSVKLGIEKKLPVWEIIYIGDDDRLTYYKMYFENGSYLNSIKP